MSREKVLSLLLEQGDRYVSGEAMSRALGISRAAVWKAIEALRQEGYVIQSAPNRGYRLENAPDRVREGELSGGGALRPPLRLPGGGEPDVPGDHRLHQHRGQAPGHGRGPRRPGHRQ